MGKKFVFSDDQINYILDNWGIESIHSMKKKFGCSWDAIKNVGIVYNLELPKANIWSDEEISLLKKLAVDCHYTEIAEVMNKTDTAIYLKAKKLNIKLIQTRKKWSTEEENLLKEYWGTIKLETISNKMHRSVNSIKIQAYRMGLGSMIYNNCLLLTVTEISNILDVSRDRITTTWVKLGLNLKKKKVSNNRSYLTISLDDLIVFLKCNLDVWDSRKVEPYILGEESEWLLKKRKSDRDNNPIGYRVYSDDEKRKVVNMFKHNDDITAISKELNRSEYSIKRILNLLGYSYIGPSRWSYESIDYLEKNINNDTYLNLSENLGRTKKAVEAKAAELGITKKKKKSLNSKD